MLIQRQCSGVARAPTPPRQKPSDWLTRLTPARRDNLSTSLHRIIFVLTRCFPERLKNANLSFRKQLKNDLKAIRAGQTWSGVEKKTPPMSRLQYTQLTARLSVTCSTIYITNCLVNGLESPRNPALSINIF